MSLLHEARENIGRERIREEERIRQREEYARMRPQREEQARKNREEDSRLSSDIVSQTEELLEKHGVLSNVNRYVGIKGKARRIWESPGKELTSTLTDVDEEPVDVTFKCKTVDPKRSNITIQIQGIATHLDIPADRTQTFMLLRDRSGSSVTIKDLRQYKEVVDKVREKLESLASPPQGSSLK